MTNNSPSHKTSRVKKAHYHPPGWGVGDVEKIWGVIPESWIAVFMLGLLGVAVVLPFFVGRISFSGLFPTDKCKKAYGPEWMTVYPANDYDPKSCKDVMNNQTASYPG